MQADEELLLLEALDMFGLGNWTAVGEHVNRSPQECAAHYEAIYLRSPAFPLATPAPEMAGVPLAPPPLPPHTHTPRPQSSPSASPRIFTAQWWVGGSCGGGVVCVFVW